MATVQLSQRPLLVLAGAIVLHIILISAQVSTTAGHPVLQVVTFGAFSEVQRGTMNSIDSVRGLWTGYVALRDRAGRERVAASASCRRCRCACRKSARTRSAPRACASCSSCGERAGLETVAAEIIAGPRDADFRDMTIDKGSSDGLEQDMAVISPSRRGRARDPAERRAPRRCSC